MSSMSIVKLVTAPLSVAQIPLFLGLRVTTLGVLIWWRSIRALCNLHIRVCVGFVVFLVALFTFPIRVLTALERENKVCSFCVCILSCMQILVKLVPVSIRDETPLNGFLITNSSNNLF